MKDLIYIVVFICYKLAKYESKNFSQCIKNIRAVFFNGYKYMTAFSSVKLILSVGARLHQKHQVAVWCFLYVSRPISFIILFI